MTTPIIICDDSGMARKGLARSLPVHWDVDVTFAANGEEALQALESGAGEIMFLDLTMPVMDGYQTLEAIAERGIDVMVIVVSGDIQEEARRRVMALGAVDFIKKPAEPMVIEDLLIRFGILAQNQDIAAVVPESQLDAPADQATQPVIPATKKVVIEDPGVAGLTPELADCYREIVNVAMGRAGDLLSRLTGQFVQLPIPKVAMLEPSSLHMALNSANSESVSAVCQGFIGTGISGEALLLFNDTSFEKLAELMRYDRVSKNIHVEVLTDVSGALLGAILNGLGEQLNLNFSQSYPVVLGRHASISDLIEANVKKWQDTLTIEVIYGIENQNIHCDVLLLFTASSIPAINARLDYYLSTTV